MPDTEKKRFSPAVTRNREPILDVLRGVVAGGERVLEIASGSGEHALFLAPRLPIASWQPSDPDATSLASIDAWREEDTSTKVLPALELDVIRAARDGDAIPRADLVVCMNMIHIAPWEATLGLMHVAERAVAESTRGMLVLYGPFKREGAHTAPSNAAFDESLRGRDASWGVRDLEAVVTEAAARGFVLERVVAMPANNLSVVLARSAV